ncbi:GNAT family N-acetyltransferase [Priestia megaterium]|jgi:GNAT superfamily N-acetyltransferase|uniref:GNAT family N-acetyltransferase n=1 Tax=Priestia megaterium TaxID=1404 RepID=UPI00286697C6|nr:GNAT family N-acetyltransferase [Priestia megaterium]MDR7246724.1 GNAT superfamily N-acetyltransferase [Priestia megaterium]
MLASTERILELTNQNQFLEAFPILNQLRTDLTEVSYLELLTQMKQNGYKLFALYREQSIIVVAGISLQVNFYNKKYVFVYDLITDAAHRSQGYVYRLLSYIDEWAKSNGAQFVALESGIQRIDAHRFYEEKLNYDKWCYSFHKLL